MHPICLKAEGRAAVVQLKQRHHTRLPQKELQITKTRCILADASHGNCVDIILAYTANAMSCTVLSQSAIHRLVFQIDTM